MDATRGAEGERKLVSALFADFEGFTRMVAEGDPELVRERLNGAFGRLIPAVVDFGGTVEKIVGDGVMALFGAPSAHGDDAVRACRAAEALRRELEAYDREFGLSLALHIGIGTGIVVAGEFGPEGYRGYAATGDAVNRAARLAAAAPAGRTYCDEATAAAAAPAFDFETLAPLALKGFREEQRAFRLIGEKASGGAARSPFVGREAELATLRRLAEAGGECVAYIYGEAGIGKSRLTEEFLGSYPAPGAPGASHGSIAARAAAPAYGKERPYALWRELASGAGIGGWPESLGEREADDEGYDEAARAAEGAASAFALELLGSLGRRGRRIVALDGLERADAASMGLTAAVAAAEDVPPFLWILAGRGKDDARLALDAFARRGAPVIELELGPLGEDELRRLSGRLSPGRELDYGRCGGNPLYLEELARAPAGGELGMGLFGLVCARIDALPGPAKEALRAAAALGEASERGLLARLAPDADPVPAERAGLLEGERGGALRFKHAVVRDVVYQTMLAKDRKRLHAAAARAIKAWAPGLAKARPGVMAMHWRESGELKRALPYYLAHGDDLYYGGAFNEAARVLEEGLAAAASLGAPLNEAALAFALARAQANGETPLTAIPSFERALRIYRTLSNRSKEISILAGMAWAYRRAERPQEAEAAYAQALKLARDVGSLKEELRIRLGLGWLRLESGNAAQASAEADAALRIAGELKLERLRLKADELRAAAAGGDESRDAGGDPS